jgi:hypothetical protein
MATIPDYSSALSMRVVDEVADAKDVPVEDLSPLYHAIEPDALDKLFSTAEDVSSLAQVRFQYEGCTVVVSGDGTVETVPDEDRSADTVSQG